jgi:phosphatidylglycerol---prolipoprotein diacylglyceryl transferase
VHPRLLQFGHLVLPTYGVLLSIGLVVSLLVCLHTARVLSLDKDKVWNLAVLAIVVTIGGAKLLVIAGNWAQYGTHALALSLNSEPGALLRGVAMAIAACWLYAWRAQMPVRRTADALAPALALGGAFVSVACLEAGCGFGTPTHVPWAVTYTSPFADPRTPLGVPLHPTQVYSGTVDFALFVLSLWLLYRPHHDGEVMGAWLFLGGLSTFFLDSLRGDSGSGALLGGALNVSQAVATVMVLLGGYLWLRRSKRLEVSHAS